jgi:hypothetical protein
MIIDELEYSGGKNDFIELDDDTKVKAGMVRASFGIYNTEEDVNSLVNALKDIVKKRNEYTKLYQLNEDRLYKHKSFQPEINEIFNADYFITDYLKNL